MNENKIMEHCHSILETLTEELSAYFENGMENVKEEEASAVVDMIKDMAEAKEKMAKGLYYIKTVKAMENKEDEAQTLGINEYMEKVTRELVTRSGRMNDMERQVLRNKIQMLQDRI